MFEVALLGVFELRSVFYRNAACIYKNLSAVMLKMNKKILFQGNDVVVVGQDFPTDTVFVTFNSMGEPAEGDKFWGDKFFFKNQIAAIGVMSTRPNWFPEREMRSAICQILQVTGARKVITYGHSQGGYAALKFSRALGSEKCISSCPQWSINPKDVGEFDSRFFSYYKGNNGERITDNDLCRHCYIFFDPLEKRDAKNAELISLEAPDKVRQISAPFSGHSTILLFSESRLAIELIRLFEKGTPSLSACRNLVRRTRNKSSTYQTEKIRRLLPRAAHSSIFLERTISTVSAGQRAAFELMLMIEKKDMNSANEKLHAVESHHLLSPEPLTFWKFFRERSFLSGEIRVAELLHERYPDTFYFQLHVLNTFVLADRKNQALPILEKLALVPESAKHIGHISAFARKLGRADLLERVLKTADSMGLITSAQKATLEVAVCDIYRENGLQSAAIEKLSYLVKNYSDSIVDLQRIKDCAARLGVKIFVREGRAGYE